MLLSRRTAVCGAVHAAGVSTKEALLDVDLVHLAAAYAPKAIGAYNIHCATAALSLDASLMISSISAFWCRVGQACYGAANAFLDAHAPARRAHGKCGLSLALPGVEGVGMGAALSVRRTIQMTLDEYDAALAALLTTRSTNAVSIALPSTLDRFLTGTPDGLNPLFRETVSQSGKQPEAPFALPSCHLRGRRSAAAALRTLATLPENSPVLLELVELSLDSDEDLVAFAQRQRGPIVVVCRGRLDGEGVSILLDAATVVLSSANCILHLSTSAIRRRGGSDDRRSGSHTANEALFHGWLDAVYPDAVVVSEAQRLAARLARPTLRATRRHLA